MGRWWLQGIRPTIFLLALVILITIAVNFLQSLESFLNFFLPEEKVFWGMPFLATMLLLIIVPFLMGVLTSGRTGKIIGSRVERVPVLNMVFTGEKKRKIAERSFPGVLKVNIGELNLYIYVFATGISKLTENGTEKTIVSVFPPSIPLVFTSLLAIDVNIENVKKVEVEGNNGSAGVDIVQKKFIGFGQPLGEEITLKDITKEEIEGHLLQKRKSADR